MPLLSTVPQLCACELPFVAPPGSCKLYRSEVVVTTNFCGARKGPHSRVGPRSTRRAYALLLSDRCALEDDLRQWRLRAPSRVRGCGGMDGRDVTLAETRSYRRYEVADQ